MSARKHNNICSYLLSSGRYPDITLSKRQSQCLFYLLRGKSAAATANILRLSTRTIESYIEEIKNKMGCRNKAELIEKALSLGYLEITPQGIIDNRSQNYFDVEKSDRKNRSLIFLENAVRNLPQYIFWKDVNSVYLGCNDSYAKLIGLNSSDSIIGKTDLDIGWLSDGDSAELFRQGDRETMTGKSIINQEECLSSPNGKKVLVLVNKGSIYDDNNNLLGVLGVATDITGKTYRISTQGTNAEKGNKNIEKHLKSVIDSIAGNHWWKDINGQYMGLNSALAKELGLSSAAEIIGKTDYDMPWANVADELIKHDREVMESGLPKTQEEQVFVKDGRVLTFLVKKVPFKNDDGNIIGTVGTSFDITDRKLTEERRN